MQIIKTEIPDVLIIEPKLFGDQRGFFSRRFKANATLLRASGGRSCRTICRAPRMACCADCICRIQGRRASW